MVLAEPPKWLIITMTTMHAFEFSGKKKMEVSKISGCEEIPPPKEKQEKSAFWREPLSAKRVGGSHIPGRQDEAPRLVLLNLLKRSGERPEWWPSGLVYKSLDKSDGADRRSSDGNTCCWCHGQWFRPASLHADQKP